MKRLRRSPEIDPNKVIGPRLLPVARITSYMEVRFDQDDWYRVSAVIHNPTSVPPKPSVEIRLVDRDPIATYPGDSFWVRWKYRDALRYGV